MPARRKPPGTHQDRRNGRRLAVVRPNDPAVPKIVPPAPTGILEVSEQIWTAFWQSESADFVDPGLDLYRLRRWIETVDERERLMETFRESPIVEGSTGQAVLNPVSKRLGVLEAQIKEAEEAFGMTPAARLKLGIGVSAGGTIGGPSVHQLNEAVRRSLESDGLTKHKEDDLAAEFESSK